MLKTSTALFGTTAASRSVNWPKCENKCRSSRSVKSVCVFHDNARPYIAVVTTGTLEILPRPGLAPSDFYLFGPEPTMKLNFLCDSDGWMRGRELSERGIMKLRNRWRRCIEVQGE